MRLYERFIIAVSLATYLYGLFVAQVHLGIGYLIFNLFAFAVAFYYEGIRHPFYLQTLHSIGFMTLVVGFGFQVGTTRTVMDVIGVLTSCLSITITVLFGEVNFKRIRLNGPYQVGFKEFRTSKYDNMVSVFYPIY
jgi:hypothetical protein